MEGERTSNKEYAAMEKRLPMPLDTNERVEAEYSKDTHRNRTFLKVFIIYLFFVFVIIIFVCFCYHLICLFLFLFYFLTVVVFRRYSDKQGTRSKDTMLPSRGSSK